MPSAFFVECLLTNPSSISIRGIRWTNPSHTTPSRCRIIPFLLEYHQSHDVKYSVTLFRPKQPTTYTHTLSSQNLTSFLLFRIDSNRSIRRHHHQQQQQQFVRQQSLHRSMGGMMYRITLFPLLIFTAQLLLDCSSRFLRSFRYGWYSRDQRRVGYFPSPIPA